MFLTANWAQVKIHFQLPCKISLSSRVWKQEAALVYFSNSEKLGLSHQVKSAKEEFEVFANNFHEVKMLSNSLNFKNTYLISENNLYPVALLSKWLSFSEGKKNPKSDPDNNEEQWF